jgi:cell division initiation protein
LRISPLDVRNQDFKKSLRGYDPEEVKAFLDAIADTMEEVLKEKEVLESELNALKMKMETFNEMEKSLRDAMVSAQKAGDEAKLNARRNADLMIREAEIEVRQRISDAKRKVDEVFRTRDSVKTEMRAFLPRLRSLLESQINFLRQVEEDLLSGALAGGEIDLDERDTGAIADAVESHARDAAAAEAEARIKEAEARIRVPEEHGAQPAPAEEAARQHAEQPQQGAHASEHQGEGVPPGIPYAPRQMEGSSGETGENAREGGEPEQREDVNA